MSELDREVAGLRCREVLAVLSEYLDGELPRDRRARVEAHVRRCERCERFGGAFGAVVGALRRELAQVRSGPDDAVKRRLHERLGV